MNPRIARLAFLVLAIAACVNLAAGATLALRDPARASDLWIMYDWCGRWLAGGEGLYTAPDAVTDYPPNAIVMLSPLALLPWPWLVPLWTAFGLALAPVLAYLVIRCASRGDRFVAAVPMLLFLCWTSTRTLLQFSALSMTLAFLSLRLVDSHRLASGVALGLALFKPHIAGPIALWMVVTGRARVAIVASAVVLVGWTAYDARIGENPLTTLDGYRRVLGTLHAGPDGLLGRTDLRGWTRILTADPQTADAWWIALSALLLAGVWWLARRDPRRPLEAGGSAARGATPSALGWSTGRIAALGATMDLHHGQLAVTSLFCLWSLLAFYHNTNNLIMMLPTFVFAWFLDDRSARSVSEKCEHAPSRPAPPAKISRNSQAVPREARLLGARERLLRRAPRWVPIVLLQAALMFDVPTRLGPRMSHEGWAKVAVDDFDRLLVLASFAYVALRWYRLTRPDVRALPPARSHVRKTKP